MGAWWLCRNLHRNKTMKTRPIGNSHRFLRCFGLVSSASPLPPCFLCSLSLFVVLTFRLFSIISWFLLVLFCLSGVSHFLLCELVPSWPWAEGLVYAFLVASRPNPRTIPRARPMYPVFTSVELAIFSSDASK